ncbi:MAG: hypothetical protein ACT4OQ_10935 [Chloroflexota bacterium]
MLSAPARLPKELLGGFIIVEAADMDEAVAMAAEWAIADRPAQRDRAGAAGVRARLSGMARGLHSIGFMEVIAVLIVLAVGLMLERSRRTTRPVRVESRDR